MTTHPSEKRLGPCGADDADALDDLCEVSFPSQLGSAQTSTLRIEAAPRVESPTELFLAYPTASELHQMETRQAHHTALAESLIACQREIDAIKRENEQLNARLTALERSAHDPFPFSVAPPRR